MAKQIVYWNGDKAQIIGPPVEIHGGTFYPARLLEGQRKGEEIVIAARHVEAAESK